VLHLEAQGGVISGKTNTPEFGAGGHTFNEIFGATRNPWNLSKSAGGSSGGAAASLAAGTSWLATGSDYAGSLRTPAAFCGVVGLRPSPFRVPSGPTGNPFENAAVQGPMARNVADTAFFLDMLSWENPDAPITTNLQRSGFLAAARKPNTKARIAFSTDLGLEAVQTDIANVVSTAVEGLERSGFPIQPVDLSLRFMDEPYHTFRALDFAAGLGEHLEDHRDKLKPEIVWNIEKGLHLTGTEVALAVNARADAFNKMLAVFETNDVLICPASVTKPFNVENRYFGHAKGLGYENYLDWLAITYVLTPLGLPVLALPCGMTENGLPVGIQIVGKPRGEAALISVGAAIEAAIGQWATCEKELEILLQSSAAMNVTS
jgi:amidase